MNYLYSYFTLTGLDHYLGNTDLNIGDSVVMKRDHENKYDPDAIQIWKGDDLRGYVANSKYTAFCATVPASQLVGMFNTSNETHEAVIEVVFSNFAICKVVA